MTDNAAPHGVGVQAPRDISPAFDWYRKMVFVRRFEEQAERSFRRGKIGGYLHLYTGQEAVAMRCLAALQGDDIVFTGYRDHARALMRGVPPGAVMAEWNRGRPHPARGWSGVRAAQSGHGPRLSLLPDDVTEFAAIINKPQAAILATGRIQQRARVHDGQVTPRPVLGDDHRG